MKVKILYLFLGLLIFQNPVNSQQKPFNILFISIDDLRPALGCFGDSLAITPNIDKISKQGVVFTRAYVQAASCAPSRTSMLTGLRPDEVRVTDHKTHFRDTRPDVITLPLVDLCGIKSKGDLSGVSLKPLLINTQNNWKNVAFNQSGRPYEAAIVGKVPATHMGYSGRTDKWRYTAW